MLLISPYAPLHIRKSLHRLRWDHSPLGFSLFLHMLQGTMGGSLSQNLSIIPYTVTEILQFEKCVKCRPGIYRPEFKMLITLVHFVIISSNLVSRLLFIESNKRNPCFQFLLSIMAEMGNIDWPRAKISEKFSPDFTRGSW